MTKTRPSSNLPSRPSSRREAEQGSWSDSEDSMGYHVHYLPTTTIVTPANHPTPPAPRPATVEPTMTTISIGGILTKIPANLATAAWSGTRAPFTNTEQEKEKCEKLIHLQGRNTPSDDYPESTGCRGPRPSESPSPPHIPIMPMTQSLINRGLYKDPNSSVIETTNNLGTEPVPPPPSPKGPDTFRSDRAWSGAEATKHIPIMPIAQSLINRGLHREPNNTAPSTVLGTQPMTPPTPPKALDGSATSRAWSDVEAMVGYAKPAKKQHTDERGSYAACAAVSPGVVLAGLSAEYEGVPTEATMQKYGRTLRELPGDQSRRVRALMESIYETFPDSVGEDKWYLSTIGALIGSDQPQYIADLYAYLCSNPGYQTSAQRQALARRMREALFKCIPINGIAVVTEAVTALASVEELYDQDHGTRWAGKQITPEKLECARATIAQLHGPEHVKEVYAACGSHVDLAWINENIVYGLFLADHSILSIEETELVVLPAMVSTGLKGPAEAHLKAALRLGMQVEEVEQIHRISEMLAGWKGTSLTLMKRAKDL